MHIRTVLFDLDGTLIHSVGLILDSYHHTLAQHGLPARTDSEWLKGVGTPLAIQTGLVTSKNRYGALRGLKLVGLAALMDVLVCADEVTNPKPHPEPVEKAVSLLGADPATTLYVGDSVHDMHSGRAAGVLTAAALWGPFQRSHLEQARPDYWLGKPSDLVQLINHQQPETH